MEYMPLFRTLYGFSILFSGKGWDKRPIQKGYLAYLSALILEHMTHIELFVSDNLPILIRI